VQNVKIAGPKFLIDEAVCFSRPHRAHARPDVSQLLHTSVVFHQKFHFVTVIAKKSGVCHCGLVFAARNQILVMEHEDLHVG
jgi:hypothetical protein